MVAPACLWMSPNPVGLHPIVERASWKSTPPQGRAKADAPFGGGRRRRLRGEPSAVDARRALLTSSSAGQLGQPPLQEPALRLLSSELDRALVGDARLRGLA